jgi:hypothetical protein
VNFLQFAHGAAPFVSCRWVCLHCGEWRCGGAGLPVLPQGRRAGHGGRRPGCREPAHVPALFLRPICWHLCTLFLASSTTLSVHLFGFLSSLCRGLTGCMLPARWRATGGPSAACGSRPARSREFPWCRWTSASPLSWTASTSTPPCPSRSGPRPSVLTLLCAPPPRPVVHVNSGPLLFSLARLFVFPAHYSRLATRLRLLTVVRVCVLSSSRGCTIRRRRLPTGLRAGCGTTWCAPGRGASCCRSPGGRTAPPPPPSLETCASSSCEVRPRPPGTRFLPCFTGALSRRPR